MNAVLPQFVELGTNKIDDLPSILGLHRITLNEVLILYDETTARIGGQRIVTTLRRKAKSVVGDIVENSDEPNVSRIESTIKKNKPGLVIGFGGGKVMDVAKKAAGAQHVRFISIPTTLSNDGLASPVSVIKDAHNIPVSHITSPPHGVIIDINIVKNAPHRHLLAGVGDLMSNLSAVFDARLAPQQGTEKYDNDALPLAEAGGLKLLRLKTRDIESTTFLRNLAQGLIKSGFAMCIWGTSRPASGSEHKISHSIDHYFPSRKALHGEQVGIAAIFTMAMQRNKSFDRVKAFYEDIGFPTKLSYLGLNTDEFVKVVLNATKIRPERHTILEEMKPTASDVRRVLRRAGL
jgi:glycerol-1-phosphate dehydrogenase [NAD(P)+]